MKKRIRRIKSKSTSYNTADIEEIVLSESDFVRVSFCPMIVNNEKNEENCVRGCLVYQKKRKADDFEPYTKLSRSKMKVGDWMEISLNSEEVQKLYEGIKSCHAIFEDRGIELGESDYEVISSEESDLFHSINENEEELKVILENDPDIVKQIFEFLSDKVDDNEIIEQLRSLSASQLQNVSAGINKSRIISLINEWSWEEDNDEEEYWQNLFSINSWIISQCFGIPAILLEDKAYVGGKGIDNSGGNVIDFIYQNELTNNIGLIEIKTPATKIVKKRYRQTYSFTEDFVGSINQVLNYRKEVLHNYQMLAINTDRDFKAINPKCIVIIGKISNMAEEEISAFENYRNELVNVEIITFDELLKRITNLLEVYNV